jgi:hypothetical protein
MLTKRPNYTPFGSLVNSVRLAVSSLYQHHSGRQSRSRIHTSPWKWSPVVVAQDVAYCRQGLDRQGDESGIPQEGIDSEQPDHHDHRKHIFGRQQQLLWLERRRPCDFWQQGEHCRRADHQLRLSRCAPGHRPRRRNRHHDGWQGVFAMTGGSLAYTPSNGPLSYVTNSTGIINLKGVGVTAGSGILVNAAGNDRRGTADSDGGTAILTADGQTLAGDLEADDISTIAVTLQNGSSLTGSVNSAHAAKAVNLKPDASSVWNVTADSYLTCVTDPDGI